MQKLYLAVLDGEPAGEGGVVDMPLGKVSSREEGWRIVPDAGGKAASTRWEVLARLDGRALIAMRPATGRTHQLRVHAASGIGVPIVGDPTYGRGGGPMLLHAATLTVPRPGKEPVRAQAPVPERFGAFAAYLPAPDRPDRHAALVG